VPKITFMAFDGSRAQFYRDQARQIREIAEACVVPEIKEQLERVARQYEALARPPKKDTSPK
jgi:hypothetical protein